MGFALVRYGSGEWGAVREGTVFPLASGAVSLRGLLVQDVPGLVRAAWEGKGVALAGLELLAPVTAPCQIICQGKNYLDHLLETGVALKNKDYNLLFTKADSSLSSARGAVVRPAGVRLLDYELELGLVLGRDISGPVEVGEGDLPGLVAGLVMGNDLSARDVQIPERQWFRGKSFRGFCPVGPYFYFMEQADWARLFDLELLLKVNGAVKQKASVGQMMHRPAETLGLISRTFDLRTGDLLLTGTPGGVSMRVPKKAWWEEVLDVWRSDKVKFARFVEEQAASGRYLRDGDVIECSIRTADGAMDLGEQRLVVKG